MSQIKIAICSFLSMLVFMMSVGGASASTCIGTVTGLYHLEDYADSSGNGNTIASHSNNDFQAAKFSNGFHATADGGVGTFTSGFSTYKGISLWFKSALNTNQYLLYGSPDGVVIQINAGTLLICNSDCSQTLQGSFSDTTSFHNLIVNTSVNANKAEAYLDGTSFASNTSFGTDADFIGIGRNNVNGLRSGSFVDDLAFNSTNFSTSQIAAIYASGTGSELGISGCAGAPTATTSVTFSDLVVPPLLLIFVLMVAGIFYMRYP